MGMFDGKSKEQKQQEEVEKFMKKYQLEEINEKDLVVLKRIANDLTFSGYFKLSTSIAAKNEDIAKVKYLSVLVEQNWLIFRKLDEISKKLEKHDNK